MESTNFIEQYNRVFQSAPVDMKALLRGEQSRAMGEGAKDDEAARAALRMASYAGWYEAAPGSWQQMAPDVRSKLAIRKVHQQPDGLYSAFDIPIFYQNAVKQGQDGEPVIYDAAEVGNIISNTNRGNQMPALTPYHVIPQQKLVGHRVPVLGKAFDFQVDPFRPGWMLASFRDLTPDTVKAWKEGQIFSFSPGIVEDAGGANRRIGHVAMLGAEAPALSALPTTEIYQCEQVCFAAEPMASTGGGDRPGKVKTMAENKGNFAGITPRRRTHRYGLRKGPRQFAAGDSGHVGEPVVITGDVHGWPKGTKLYAHHSGGNGHTRWLSEEPDGSSGAFVFSDKFKPVRKGATRDDDDYSARPLAEFGAVREEMINFASYGGERNTYSPLPGGRRATANVLRLARSAVKDPKASRAVKGDFKKMIGQTREELMKNRQSKSFSIPKASLDQQRESRRRELEGDEGDTRPLNDPGSHEPGQPLREPLGERGIPYEGEFSAVRDAMINFATDPSGNEPTPRGNRMVSRPGRLPHAEEINASMDDDDMEDNDEPGEDDITTEDHQNWYQYGKLYHEGDYKSLKQKMQEDQFFPDVYSISDHGNSLNLGRAEYEEQQRNKKARKPRKSGGDSGAKQFDCGMPHRLTYAAGDESMPEASQGGEGGLDLGALKAEAQKLEAAIAAAEAGEEGAEAKLEEALAGIEQCVGGEQAPPTEGGEMPPGEGEELAPGDGGAEEVAVDEEDAGPGDNFSPMKDSFHGYSARQRTTLSGDAMPRNFDANDHAGELFAANPQAAFSGLFEVAARQSQQIKELTGAVTALVKDRQSGREASAFSAERTKFEGWLNGDQCKGLQFDAAGALATFDASKGSPKVVEGIKKMILAAPKKVAAGDPAGAGQVFEAGNNFSANDGQTLGKRREGRDVRMSEVLPGAADDPKLGDLASKLYA